MSDLQRFEAIWQCAKDCALLPETATYNAALQALQALYDATEEELVELTDQGHLHPVEILQTDLPAMWVRWDYEWLNCDEREIHKWIMNLAKASDGGWQVSSCEFEYEAEEDYPDPSVTLTIKDNISGFTGRYYTGDYCGYIIELESDLVPYLRQSHLGKRIIFRMNEDGLNQAIILPEVLAEALA